MSQLTDNLNLISSIKGDIKDAIEAKGVSMTGVSFGSYADKIGEIPTRGDIGQITISSNGTYYAYEENLDGWEKVNVDVPFGDGTWSRPYDITEARKVIDASPNGTSSMYVRGLVNNVYSAFSQTGNYGNANFWVCPILSSVAWTPLSAYRLLYFDNQKYNDVSVPEGVYKPDVQVGDEVIMYGAFRKYNNSYQTIQNQTYLYAINNQYGIMPDPSLALGITSNGVYDVTYYGSVNVDVQQSATGFTEKEITEKDFTMESIDNGASYVGSYIFQSNNYIRTVNLPECKVVNDNAFGYCFNLSEISLPVCESIGAGAFFRCSSLEYVDLPECRSVYAQAFAYCSDISYLNLPECVTIYSSAFSQCSSLAEVSLPNCKTISYYAFYSTSISSLYLPVCSFIDANAFANCSFLEEADLPKVIILGTSAFASCYSLSEISLPMCNNLSQGVFAACSSLSQMTIGMETYKVASFGQNCLANTPFLSGVGSIYVPACNYDRYVVANGWSSVSTRIVGVGDPSDYLLSYSNGLVYGRTEVLNMNFYSDLGVPSASVISVRLTNCDYFEMNNYSSSPFRFCPNLKSVELEACTTVNSSMFYYASSLEYASLKNCTRVNQFGFLNASRLNEVYIPQCEYVGYGAFNGCASLTDIDFPVCSYVESQAFQSCSRLSSAVIPSCEYIGNDAFINCSSLKEMDLPVCSYLSDRAFRGCNSLSKVSLPVCEYIGSSVFHATRLTEIVLPECSFIGYGAFYQCYSLSYVSLGKCSYISGAAFNQCSRIDTIVLGYDGVCGIENNTFNPTSNIRYIYVPESLVSDYKSAQYWSAMSSKIYALLPDLSFRDGLVYGWATSLDSGYLNELGISAGDVTGVSMSRLGSVASSTFMNHQNLVSLDIPLVEEYPDDLFNGCTGFSEFNIGVSVLGDRVFANCTGLEKVVIGYGGGIVTAGSSLFQNCPNLSQIGVPNELYSDYLTAPGWSEYSSLIYAMLPWLSYSGGLVYGRATTIDSTYLATLGINSNSVVSVSLPDCVSVGYRTFLECHNLKDVYLPNCEYLSNGAFYGANYMNGLDLPKCSFIGDYAFYWVTYSMSYLKLGYSGVCTLEGGNALYQVGALRSIYVPASLVSDYKVAPYWSQHSSKILPIQE